jgi:hypothetical protein
MVQNGLETGLGVSTTEDLSFLAPKPRIVGSLERGSSLLSGILLHQTRRDVYTGCGDVFAKLNVYCTVGRQLYPSDSLRGGEPFGREPAFNPRKPQYNPRVVGKEGEYFNMTAGSGEVASTGHPFAFFPRPVKGLPLGFPIYFDVRAHWLETQLPAMRAGGVSSCSKQQLGRESVACDARA